MDSDLPLQGGMLMLEESEAILQDFLVQIQDPQKIIWMCVFKSSLIRWLYICVCVCNIQSISSYGQILEVGKGENS